MKLELGQVVQNFAVERVLGSGGTAVVYLVRDRGRGSVHALKVLTVSSPAIRERMRREGEVQSALQHPNIVPVDDVIDLDGSPALVMEYIEGPTLDAALKRYRLTLDDA
ncbi:MAG: protein kinase, partial [Myxococcota bacterium]